MSRFYPKEPFHPASRFCCCKRSDCWKMHVCLEFISSECKHNECKLLHLTKEQIIEQEKECIQHLSEQLVQEYSKPQLVLDIYEEIKELEKRIERLKQRSTFYYERDFKKYAKEHKQELFSLCEKYEDAKLITSKGQSYFTLIFFPDWLEDCGILPGKLLKFGARKLTPGHYTSSETPFSEEEKELLLKSGVQLLGSGVPCHGG